MEMFEGETNFMFWFVLVVLVICIIAYFITKGRK